ncbi:MAG TPA: HD domain-containing protein [Anaerolineales bacterium]|nr:HD domain-containing protein [Anaerolineales bacterium]
MNRSEPDPSSKPVPPAGEVPLDALLDFIRPALPPRAEIYVVGGAVRDRMLGQPVHDVDFVLAGNGLAAARHTADHLEAEYYPLDPERGTGRVLVPRSGAGRLILDFSVMRGATLEEDQRRRDFTINAMALDARDPARGFDPLGGAGDIREKRIRVCSPDSFEDDPVRVLRAVRFAAQLGFRIEPDTRARLRASVHRLAEASPERRRDETLKILGGRSIAAALAVMDLLEIFPLVFPGLREMKGVQQPEPHVHDVWEHTLRVVKHLEELLDLLTAADHDPEAGNLVTGQAVLRLGRYREQIRAQQAEALVPDRSWRGPLFLAALYHDAGKPATQTIETDGRIRFTGHEKVSADMARGVARDLVLSNDEKRRLVRVVRHHMRPHFLAWAGTPPTRRAIYRFFRDTGPAGADIALLVLADVLGAYEQTLTAEMWGNYLDLSRILLENWWEHPEESVRPPPLLNGTDLIERFDLAPGPLIGELLAKLREAQAAGEVGDRDGALRFIEDALASN